MYSKLNKSTIVQVTSLLRAEDEPDKIKFTIRRFQQQTQQTRICGFYAAAAAFSCCQSVDPTGFIYDESLMSQHMLKCLRDDTVELFPAVPTVRLPSDDIVQEVYEFKLHCRCQSKFNGMMIQCSTCLNWYHTNCVVVGQTPVREVHAIWKGPCCDTTPISYIDIVVIK